MKMTKVDSSVVAGYFYNDETQALLIEYHNKSVYLYQDISASTVKKVFSAESIGKAFRKHVLDKDSTPIRIK
jgi:hypothetical protein